MVNYNFKKLVEKDISFDNAFAIRNCCFAIVLFVTVFSVFVPFIPEMPGKSLDPSWMLGMNEAVANGLSFGRDIIFTFGPYASIYTETYHPATYHLMMSGSLYLGLSFSIVAYLIFKRAEWYIQILFVLGLASIVYFRDSLFFFYTLMVGQLAYLSAVRESGRPLANLPSVILLAFLFAPFGLLPLIKGTALIACTIVVLLSLLMHGIKKLWVNCLVVAFAPVVSMLFFWGWAGQSYADLPHYFYQLIPIMSGYTEAMAKNGNIYEILAYILVGALIIGFLVLDLKRAVCDNLIMVLVFVCILFLSFKAGFVRHDSHALICGSIILLAGLLSATLIERQNMVIVVVFSILASGFINLGHLRSYPLSLFNIIKSTYVTAWHGAILWVTHPQQFHVFYDERMLWISKQLEIPKLAGSSDIYSYDQSFLIASDNEWNPRPVLQSYSAYNTELSKVNRDHLLGVDGPDSIIFKVQPIDGRLPALEDGASWPVLVSNYEVSSFFNEYLLLVRESNSNKMPDIKILAQGIFAMKEKISVPDIDEPIYIRIIHKKTIVGRIANTLFKPSNLEIQITLASGEKRAYKMVSSIGEMGFIVSPLIENTHDFASLFNSADFLVSKKVDSIELRANSFPFLWQNNFEVEFSTFSDNVNHLGT